MAKKRATSKLTVPGPIDPVQAAAWSNTLIAAYDACAERRHVEARQILAQLPPCVIRTRDAGVHYGKVVWIGDKIICVENDYRIWQWQGGPLSLSAVASVGIGNSSRVDGPTATAWIYDVIEVLPCTQAASESVESCTP